jgi:hypothetical protein
MTDYPTDKVTRVEVITHNEGRSYVNWDDNNKVELSFQDNERTLKVFISNREKSLEELEKTGITSYNGTLLMTEF